MKRVVLWLLVLLLIMPGTNCPVVAQDFGSYQMLTKSNLDRLAGPVALYPDALLIQVLQASTYPDQIGASAAWLRSNSDTSQLDLQPWDPSVVVVAHYPSVINMLYQQSDWSTQLGQTFINQRADLLTAVQRLRLQAKNQGNLMSTPQQTVVVQGDSIQIMPATTSVIYVPQYNPTIVYTQPAPSPLVPLLAFGVGIAVGSSMSSSSSVNWTSNTVVYRGYPTTYVHGAAYNQNVYYQNGSARRVYATGPNGYGQGYRAQGTGVYGNQYSRAGVAGRTWNGGSYSGSATTNQWANGAKTGSYSASGSGPNGSAASRGWGYQNGDTKAGGFSKTAANSRGAVNVSGSGATNGSNSAGSVTASAVNRQGDYKSKTWTGSNGNVSSSTRSGNVFSGARSGSSAWAHSQRGSISRGGGGFRR
jgi:hypothetical protein